MQSFQAYQTAFTAHIRDPKAHPAPNGVDDKRMAIYREIVFNNTLSTVSACYPVCQEILGKTKWQKIVRQFFATHACTSPYFRDIPKSFLEFATTHERLSQPLAQLAHYEWAELALSSMQVTPIPLSVTPNLLEEQPVLAEAHMLLSYDYAVHQMSKRNPATQVNKTFILMFRNADFEVKFIILNALTFELLSLLKTHSLTGKQALTEIASAIQHPEPEEMIAFGLEVLTDLMRQQAIVGSVPQSF